MYLGNPAQVSMNVTASAVLQNGKYVLNAILSESRFGITYQATQTYLSQSVVIQTLNPSLRQNSDFVQLQHKFIAEARVLASCRHRNLVRILDLFEETGVCYVVTEHILGQTLAELIHPRANKGLNQGGLPEAQAVHYIRQIGAALNAVHQQGLLHRNIKPQNIIRRQDSDSVVLTNFGISRELTAGYVPIEQYLQDGNSTPATDIYSLAATLYCLLTGHPPLTARLRVNETIPTSKLSIPFPHLRQFHPNLDPGVERAIRYGLQTLANQRPQTVEDWLSLLPATNNKRRVPVNTNRTPSLPLIRQSLLESRQQQTVISPEEELSLDWLSENDDRNQTQLNSGNFPSTAATTKKVQASKLKPAGQNQKFLKRSPLRKIILTSAIATCIGIGFGLILRGQGYLGPGSTLLHTEQSFPTRKNWPISDTPNQNLEVSTPETEAVNQESVENSFIDQPKGTKINTER